MGARFRLAALFSLLAFPAMAQTPMWVANATLSPTTTLSAGHLCATDGRDIYCDATLPTTAGLGLEDRIVSGTSSVTVNSATGVVSLTQSGTTWGYLHPSLGLVAPGVSSTGTISGTKVIAGHLIAYSFGGEGGQFTLGYASTLPASEVTSTWNIDVDSGNNFRIFRRNASNTALIPFFISESTGRVGIGTSNPSATLHVAGTGYFSGNIGIGTTAPSATFHVLGKAIISSNTLNNVPAWGNPALLINNAGPAAGLAIGWNAATGQGETDFTNYGQGGVGGFNFYNAAANGATFAVTPTLVMQITSSGMVSATRFVGDGSGLTNLPGSSADRLTSGSSVVTLNSATGVVSLTQGGSTWAYLHPSLGLVAPGVSSTGPISGTDAYFAGNVGIGTIPEVALHVSGTLRAQGPVEEAVKGIPRIDIGVQAGTPRMVFEPVGAVSNSIWEIDNAAGRFRWFTPGFERMNLTASSTVSILGAATHAISNMDASNTSVALILRGTSTTEGGGAVLYGVGSTNIYAAIKGAMRNGAQNTAGDIVFATRRSAADPSLTETMRVTAEGNVGIGTPSPSAAGLVVSNTMAVGDFNGGTPYPAGRLMVYKNGGYGSPATSGGSDTAVIARLWGGSVALDYGVTSNGRGWLQQRLISNLATNYPLLLNPNGGAVAVGLITPSAVSLEVSGTVSATRFVGDGSGLTNLPGGGGSADRITSGSSVVTLNSSTGIVSLTQAGSTWGYLHPSLGFVGPGVSTTDVVSATGLYVRGSARIEAGSLSLNSNGRVQWGNNYLTGDISNKYLALNTSNTEAMRITSDGSVGIGTSNPNLTQRVQMALSAAAGNVSDTITSSTVLFLQNGNGSGTILQPSQIGLAFGYASARQAIMGGTYGADFLDFYTNGVFTNPRMRLSSVGLTVSGTISATAFVGDGSGLTNLPGGGSATAAGVSGSIQYRNSSGTLAGNSDLVFSASAGLANRNGGQYAVGFSAGDSTTGLGWIRLAQGSTNSGGFISVGVTGTLVGYFGTGNQAGSSMNMATYGNTPLAFWVSSTEAMRITTAGNVGIGVNNPSTTLHVSGTGIFTGNLGIGTTSPHPAYTVDVSGPMVIRGSNSGYFLIDRSGVSSSTIYRQSNRTRFWDDLGGDRMVIDNTTGNVGIGIGTNVPAYPLHVSGSAAFYPGNTQFPVNISLLPTGHASSRRVALNMDRWNLIQDDNGTGLKNFSLYDSVSSTQRLLVHPDGRTVFPWTQQLIVGPWQNTGSSLTVVNGEIQPGSSGAGCASGNAGAIRYASGALTYCTGSTWAALASSGTANVMALSDLSDVSKSINNLFLGWVNGANADVTNTVAVGPQVFGAGTNSGFANVAVGNSALYYNTSGRWNSAVGNNAMLYNTTGDYNTVMGFQAGIYNTTGTENTAFGAAAAYWNDTGSQNTSIGRTAGRYNVGGNNNTVLGHAAAQGISSSTVYNNVTAAGYRSLIRITTGNDNTAIGAYAGQNVSSGSSNTIMGYNAGLTLTTGSNNILIGNGANVPANGTSNYLNIGNTIYADMNSNLVGIGTAAPGYALEVKNATQYQGIALRNATNTVFRAYGSTAANDSGVMQLLNSGTVAMQLSGGNGVLTYFTGANVGIGTTAPSFPLTVSGNALFGGPSSGMGYTMATQGNSTNAGFTGFYTSDSTRVGYVGFGTGSGGWLNLATDGNTALRFVTSGTESMRIDAVGNVGIGVTSMSNPLEVRRDQNASTDVSIRNSSNLANAAARMLLTADVGSGVLTYNGSGSSVSAYAGGPSGLGIWATGSGGVALSSKSASGTLRFYTGTTPSERARIDASGNVGINTNAPAATLDVNGYMKLAKNGSAPVACGSTYDGSIALTSARRMCVCNGTSWTDMVSSTACVW